jgi:hypothetical protein
VFFFGKVALHNSFVKDGILSADFKLDKGLITLNFQGIDVFVESSGDVGYYIDVLVRSSWSHDETLEIIEKDIVRVIHETTHKCRGVWLVQSILRPQCVQELTLLKYRCVLHIHLMVNLIKFIVTFCLSQIWCSCPLYSNVVAIHNVIMENTFIPDY